MKKNSKRQSGANADSSTIADDIGNVRRHNTNALVSGRAWSFRQQLSEYQLWSADYWCPDGDGIELYIANDNSHFELECFSGIGMSKIVMHDIEFSYLQDKVKIDFREPFEIQCCTIADYFCRLFCEYNEVS